MIPSARGSGWAFTMVLASVLFVGLTGACSSTERDDEDLGQSRQELTRTLVASADTYVRALTPNKNQGTETLLRVRALGNERALVRFDTDAIASFAAGSTVLLKLTIAETGEHWGPRGRSIEVHRLTKAWSELGATWMCGADKKPWNFWPDCSSGTSWEMGGLFHAGEHPWDGSVTAAVTIHDDQSGVVTFDVSDDIAAFQSGTPNYGWIVMKKDELLPGRVAFASRETSTPPVLVASCTDSDGGPCASDGGVDSGSSADAGTGVDSGNTIDAGSSQDAGSSVDAGADDDAGDGVDAGPTCSAGACDDGNACTDDECTFAGCVHTPAPDGTVCNDGNACTVNDRCSSGTCTAGVVVGVDDGNPCTVDSCDPALGVLHVPAPLGASCADGNACNGDERCDGSGSCVAGAIPNLDDGNVCTTDRCDPVLGVTHAPVAVGTSCTDADRCNGEETCTAAGTCVASAAPIVDDGDVCTADTCEPTLGVIHTPVSGDTCPSVLSAPSLDPTVAVQMATATAFLYSGASPVQTGVATDAIDKERLAVVRGRVLDTDGTTPKGGVKVTIVGHPEYGETRTRADGQYDVAVNGGTYVVDISFPGYLTLQRQTQVKWHDWAVVDDVVMTPAYTSPDWFVAGSSSLQVVRGAVTPAGEDADGARRATIVFPENTHFTNVAIADGTPLAVQLTEFTRGPDGPKRMPGDLPANVGYTYAFEASFPAALALGVRDVTFDRDVFVYVDNFTHYPVGETVPLGYYDPAKGAWLADKSGRILKVLTTTGGEATVDVTGDGVADTGTALTDLGITTSELRTLATEYAAGAELWRVGVRHFSSWDLNWGFGPPDDARPPPNVIVKQDKTSCQTEEEGSIIGCESRTLGEEIPIVGTSLSLRYQSDRTKGYATSFDVPIIDDKPQSKYLLGAIIELRVAGKLAKFSAAAPFAPNQFVTLSWDGTDAYGRDVGTGRFDAHVRVGLVYAGVTTRRTPSFGAFGGVLIVGDRAARTLTLWREGTVQLERMSARPLGFGGWTLDAHHVADLEGRVLHRGDGHTMETSSDLDLGYAVDTIAGPGTVASLGDNGPATNAYLSVVEDIARAPDGTLYIAADGHNTTGGRIRRIGRDGIITTIAGAPPTVAKSEGAPALHSLVFPTSMQVGPDGSLYFAEYEKNQVWKITPGPTPTLHLVAGNGTSSSTSACPAPAFCGDGGDAKEAVLVQPSSLAITNDGTVFIADAGHLRIRRVGPEGKIATYFSSSLGVRRMALRADGALFLLNAQNQVLRIDPSGTVETYVKPLFGTVTTPINFFSDWCEGDGGQFLLPQPDGSFLMPCTSTVRQRTSTGETYRLAGRQGDIGSTGDGGPAIRALVDARRLVIGDDHEFIFYNYPRSIRRLRPSFATPSGTTVRIPSKDGSEIYEVGLDGRHRRTLSSLSGTPLRTFGYEPSTGLLSSIVDRSGNETRIARTSGAVTITAPHGQVTTLALDANGYLARITSPVTSEVVHVAHDASGLLIERVDPLGRVHRFDYDAHGRLSKDLNALPGSNGTRLQSTTDLQGWTVDVTSPEGRLVRHRVDRRGDFGDTAITERRTITVAPDTHPADAPPLRTVTDTYADGATTSTGPDGTKVTVVAMAADPRWGVFASYPSAVRTDVGFPTTTHSMTVSETRAVTSPSGDPFATTAQTITSIRSAAGLPNATTTRAYAAGPPATWTTTSPAGRQIRATLDSLERVTKLEILGTDPIALHPVEFHYDARGRVDEVTRGTRVYRMNYDPLTGWVESTEDPAGLGVSYASRDANGRPGVVNLPGGRALATTYDAAGNVVSMTPPGKPAHVFAWDAADRLASYDPPDLSFAPKDTTYSRDHDGLLLHLSQPGTPASFTYDALGRPQQITDAVTTAYAYDPQGRLATVTTSDGVTLTNLYDGALFTGQSVTGPFTHGWQKTYDNFLRPSSTSVDGGSTVTAAYDGDGFITAAGSMSVTRGTTGLLKKTVLGAISEAFTYDAYGAMSEHRVTGSATSYSVTYARDAAGRIDTKTETVGGVTTSVHYTYDGAGRLWQVYLDGATTPARAYTYDANGNRSEGTYDGQDRLLTEGGIAYAYGSNGELAKKTETTSLAETQYSYDAGGSLRSVTRPAPFAAIDYIIDGEGRRMGKKLGGALVQGFVYEGSRILAELDGTGTVTSRFVYATGHSPDYLEKGGVVYRLVKDHLGSPRRVVDTTTGAVAQRLDYDEWGNVTSDTNPGFQPFGFAGGSGTATRSWCGSERGTTTRRRGGGSRRMRRGLAEG